LAFERRDHPVTPEKCLNTLLSEMAGKYIPIWSRWGIQAEKLFVRSTDALFVIKYKGILLTPIRALAVTYPPGVAPLCECSLRLYTAYLEDEIVYLSDDLPKRNPGLQRLTTNLVYDIAFWTATLDLHLPASCGREEDYGWLLLYFHYSGRMEDLVYYRFIFRLSPGMRRWHWEVTCFGNHTPKLWRTKVTGSIKENPIDAFVKIVKGLPLLDL
jgi:hypothetical protein